MAGTHAETAAELSRITREFPGWHPWMSDGGRWWATRIGSVLRRADFGTGRVMTVDGDEPGSLRDQLLAQSQLDREGAGLTGC